jgi:Zn finger protein HypA/HybF involved in hydrogenase expression
MTEPVSSYNATDRDIDSLKAFVEELHSIVVESNYAVRCRCGNAMLRIPVHEVADVFICPKCRRVELSGPEDTEIVYSGYTS